MRAIVVAAVVMTALQLPVIPVEAESPSPPPFFAIRNVQLVTGTGSTVDGATVLVADGLIEAVGSGVSIPSDAWVIEGDGLMLFPGLIDSLTTLGQKQEEESTGPGRGMPGRGGPEIRGPEDRPATTPWLSASDQLGEDSRIEKWREGGFTAAVSAPDKGIFSGQASLIHLGDTEDKQRVLATPVAQRLNFEGPGGFRSFPGSLMGVLSYIKQVLADTGHYTEVKAQYASSPLGRERPTWDRTLEPLEAAIVAGTPFLMPAQYGREIDRALAITDEFDVVTVLYGGQEAYSRMDTLRATKTPVLISLEWPEEETDRDPEADTPFRTLYHRQMATKSPARLAAAGVPFAFYSGELLSTSEVFEGVRAAVKRGLTNEQALRALSADAARIYGVDNRLGTIEKGKIANLVLATDWPWAHDAEIQMVFIDGRKYEMEAPPMPTEPPTQDPSGHWEVTLQSPRGTAEMKAEIEMSPDGRVKGETKSDWGKRQIEDGTMSGNLLRFKTTSSQGGQTRTSSWSVTVEGERFSGTLSMGSMSANVSGEFDRPLEPKGAALDTSPNVADDELEHVLSIFRGPVRELDSFAITNATVWTVSGETIENGTVVVAGGKIQAVGADVSIPSDAAVFDANGGAVTPGIIDAHSHMAIEGGGNEGSITVSAMVAIGDILNPDDIALYRSLAGGVTTANVLHGSANPIGGQNAVIKMRWGADAEGLKFEGAPPGIKFALGENPKRSNFRGFGIPQRYPQTRMGVMDVIREAFTEAKQYQKEWADYESGASSKIPRRDRKLDALVEILEGERLVHSHCYRADEILQLLRLAEEQGFQIVTLQHVLEGYKVADEIAAHGAGASTFSDWWGYKVEAYEAIPYNAALMTERGVLVSINSDSNEEVRHLNQEAAKAVKWGGMDEVEALKLVTLNPAKQLRIDDRVGSIEVGKDADLTVYDDHPLSVTSVVQQTFVDGDLYFDIEADRDRQALIEETKARMKGESTSTAPSADDSEDDEPEAAEEERDPPRVRWRDEVTYSCTEAGQ